MSGSKHFQAGTIRSAVLEGARALRQTSTTSDLDAELLLSFVLKQPKEYLLTYPERKLSPKQVHRFSSLIKRRSNFEPVAYLTGHKEFFGLDFRVNRWVLIPRPESELLVSEALKVMRHINQPNIVDVGTGSGAIAISIKKTLPLAKVWASDISPTALRVARANAKVHQAAIHFLQGSLLEPTHRLQFDCIISNPPYLTAAEMQSLQLKHEPRLALAGGKKGLEVYQAVLQQIPQHLKPRGCVILEIGATQAPAVHQLAQQYLPGANIFIKQDLAGHDRVVIIQKTGR